MKKAFYIFYFCQLLNLVGLAQNKRLDSLLKLIKTDQQDTFKLINLYNLSDEYETINLYPDGLYYGKQAIVLAEFIYNKPNKELIKLCAQKYKGKAHTNIGIIYRKQGNYSEALKNHFIALKIFETIGNKRGIASSYNSIGLVYSYMGNYSDALKNHFACLKTFQEMEDQFNIAKSYNNIGIIYSTTDYPKAINYFILSLKIREEIGDTMGMADSYCNLGNMYLFQGKSAAALKSHLAALEIFEKINDSTGIAGSFGNIGGVLFKQKKYNDAREYCLKSMSFLKVIGDKESIMHRLYTLTDLDSAQGNFKGAYENHKLYILYRDSLDNEETRKKTIQSQMTYDFEKKEAVAEAEHKKEFEKQELIATEKSRKQKIVIIFVVFGLLLVIVFAGFIFRSLRITRKQKDLIESQKNIVEKQKTEVEKQKIMVEEHQKEIIDSITYARRIQQSLLPTERYIEKTINRLNRK